MECVGPPFCAVPLQLSLACMEYHYQASSQPLEGLFQHVFALPHFSPGNDHFKPDLLLENSKVAAMRLINCKTLQFESDGKWTVKLPPGHHTPPYAILSHTWAENGDEVTLQEYQEQSEEYQKWAVDFPNLTFQIYRHNEARQHQTQPSKKWEKIDRTIQLALEQNIHYVWIDSCCIDKPNSHELSRSINSMFKWYADAAVCYAHIDGFETAGRFALDDATIDGSLSEKLSKCRWFRRGWTLQELIAPSSVRFYDKNWSFFGTRDGLSATLSGITKIGREVLTNPTGGSTRVLEHVLSREPIARKMSWASSRETKEKEDEAYSLLGIFGVNMPMLYGEGDQAFIRLQEAIMSITNDMTIFAWKENSHTRSEYRGVLARSPKEFQDAGAISHLPGQHMNPVYAMTNKGLQIRTRLQHDTISKLEFMSLNCQEKGRGGYNMGILLQLQTTGTYVRVKPDHLDSGRGPGMTAMPEKEIYINKKVVGPPIKTDQIHHHAGIPQRSSDVGDYNGSNEYLLSTFPPRSAQTSYYPKATSATNISPLTRDSIKIELAQKGETPYLDRTLVTDESHFHEPLDSFITADIPQFCGFVRFRTNFWAHRRLGVGTADFLLVCGLEDGDDDDDNSTADTDIEQAAAARMKGNNKRLWVCLAKAKDPIFKAHEQGLVERARDLAFQRVTHLVREKRIPPPHVLKFREMLSSAKWNEQFPPKFSMGMTVEATVRAEQMMMMNDDEDGDSKMYVVQIMARPWYAKRKLALFVFILLALLGIGLGAGLSFSQSKKETQEAFDDTDSDWSYPVNY